MKKEVICSNCIASSVSPICEVCSIGHFNDYLRKFGLKEDKLKYYNSWMLRLLENRALGLVCLSCKSRLSFICPYCFLEKTEKILNEMDDLHVSLVNFLKSFDYKKIDQ